MRRLPAVRSRIGLVGVLLFGCLLGLAPGNSEPLAPDERRLTGAPEPADTESRKPDVVPVVPKQPDDPIEAKAFAALERSCADCHQAGRLLGAGAAGGIANILALADIAREPTLVTPGLPDASRIYDVLLRRHWPVKLAPERLGDGWANPGEIEAVRDWLARLPPGPAIEACAERERVTPAAEREAIARVLADAPDEGRKTLRFLSLAPLYNACEPAEALDAYRASVALALNSLSWAAKPVALDATGPQATLLKFDLAALGWVDAHWQRLIAAYPYAGGSAADELLVLRADWFAATALTSPLYYELVGLPARVSDLEALLGVNTAHLAIRGASVRAGVIRSPLTGANRIVERLPARNGALWRSFDIGAVGGPESIQERPAGPIAEDGVDKPFRPDATRVMFNAPNGLWMFGVYSPSGERIDRLAADPSRGHEAGLAGSGQACLGCHRNGPVKVRDELRALASRGLFTPAERSAVLTLHTDPASFATLIAEDHARTSKAEAALGTGPRTLVQGLEPVTALARAYTKGGGMAQLAAELGVGGGDLPGLMAALPEPAQMAVRRVQAGAAARSDLDAVLRAFLGLPVVNGPTASAGQADQDRALARGDALTLWPNSQIYRSGDLAHFNVRSATDCNLTVLSVDSRGIATVLFPNDSEPDNKIAAGRTVRIPALNSPYQFRLKDKGREQIIALCTPSGRSFQGIEHDFERQRFTVLGNWKLFLQERLEHIADGVPAKDPAETAPRGRRNQARAAKDKDQRPTDPIGLAQPYARAIISYEVR
jgi:mono/diheme cytochrome c family protein